MKLIRNTVWGVGVGIWTLVMAGSAMASSTSVSEQHEFRLGVMEGVEEQSQPGSIKLKAAGEWEQRAWKTPDVALTTGTAVESDGSYVYVLAGATTWFARYNPDNNDWETLAAAPHTGYYGADLLYLDGAIYAIFGNYQNTFAKYDIESNSWSTLANAPDLIYRGGSLATDGVSIYALRGSASTDFWKYTLGTNSWSVITSTPATINQGASLTYDSGYLYTARGGNTNTFYRYSITSSTWSAMTNMTSAINDDSNATVREGYIYILLNNATTTFYRYSISGNSWSTLATTPQAARYVGVAYNSGDDQIYVFRGNGTYEMWKYDPDANSYAGPVDLAATPGSGADLVYYNGYIYQPRGNNSNAFYRYGVASGTWSSLANAPGNFNDDTTGVVAGAYLYFFLGSNTTTFYRYDPAGNSWTTLTAAPATIRYGGSLSYPGSGDYIYATRGNYTRSFYRYSISGNSWDDGSVADLPDNSEASYGARLLSDGTDIYYLSGSRTGALLKYTIGSNSWSAESILPYAPYWGTDAVYYGGDIFIQAGYYKDDFWRYRIATGVWQWMSGVAQYYSYDAGPYNGGALAVDPTTGVLYSIIGANILNMESMTIDVN